MTSTGAANPVTSRGDYDVNRRLLQRKIAETSNVLPPGSHRPEDRNSPPLYNDVLPRNDGNGCRWYKFVLRKEAEKMASPGLYVFVRGVTYWQFIFFSN